MEGVIQRLCLSQMLSGIFATFPYPTEPQAEQDYLTLSLGQGFPSLSPTTALPWQGKPLAAMAGWYPNCRTESSYHETGLPVKVHME